jgi:flagellar hook-basal body complex protein FliE
MAIDPLTTATAALAGTSAGSTGATGTGTGAAGFSDTLGKLISAVDDSSTDANQAVGRMLDGSGDVHEAMIALQRADVMLQLTVQVRNKLVQAYQDVMRMSV